MFWSKVESTHMRLCLDSLYFGDFDLAGSPMLPMTRNATKRRMWKSPHCILIVNMSGQFQVRGATVGVTLSL